MLAEHGLAARTDFSFILGLPWETRTEVEQTIRFATHLFVEYGVHVMLQWYRQIPGSRIWEEARRDLLVHESMYDAYGFFGNLYLFRTSCRLTPREIYEIADMTEQLRWLAELRTHAAVDRASFPRPDFGRLPARLARRRRRRAGHAAGNRPSAPRRGLQARRSARMTQESDELYARTMALLGPALERVASDPAFRDRLETLAAGGARGDARRARRGHAPGAPRQAVLGVLGGPPAGRRRHAGDARPAARGRRARRQGARRRVGRREFSSLSPRVRCSPRAGAALAR